MTARLAHLREHRAVVGTGAEIVDRLCADAAVQELRLELPYEFNRTGYEQILHDVVHPVAPALGWQRS
ncbi:hypothetical protein ACFO1B_23035 [Dactylosporangium siamense]|uniref:Uncharacterized protein n=1 Tax=Dactylosporangium siamense TaxID=685454 RepID=A0A919PLM2_9ACTN|nr:hypothetical protein [Dactylosporangium siamense]GIG47070.1 hypothetical protein Dsi01nite_051110 [Dactylosporangium siamense]